MLIVRNEDVDGVLGVPLLGDLLDGRLPKEFLRSSSGQQRRGHVALFFRGVWNWPETLQHHYFLYCLREIRDLVEVVFRALFLLAESPLALELLLQDRLYFLYFFVQLSIHYKI